MTIQTNKTLVFEHFRTFNEGDIDGFAATFAVDAVNHSAIPQAQGRTGARAIAAKLRQAFPDMTMVVDDVICAADKVVCRLTVTGTHTGRLDFAKMPLAPTGKAFTTTHIHVLRIQDGLIAERWAERDDLGMMRQLGLLPGVGAPRSEEAAQ